jgi:hypothetical protein
MLVSSQIATSIVSLLDAYTKYHESRGAPIESNDEHCRKLHGVVQTVTGLLHDTASEACANPVAVQQPQNATHAASIVGGHIQRPAVTIAPQQQNLPAAANANNSGGGFVASAGAVQQPTVGTFT